MLRFRIRRWMKRFWLPVLLIFVVFGAGFSIVYFGSQTLSGLIVKDQQSSAVLPSSPSFLGDPYDLAEYTRVVVEVFGDGVLFRDGCRGLWIAMPYEKTFSIKRGMVGELDIRPTQHDLMQDIFMSYGINMSYARVERIEHDFFYATILLETDEKLLQVDTRPSDALALAARFGAPVYVSTKLLRQKGVNVCKTDDKQA